MMWVFGCVGALVGRQVVLNVMVYILFVCVCL